MFQTEILYHPNYGEIIVRYYCADFEGTIAANDLDEFDSLVDMLEAAGARYCYNEN